MSEQLQQEVDNLKKQAIQNGQGVNGLLAQMDAMRQALNEANTQSLHFRSQCILLDKSNKELINQNNELKSQLQVANKNLDENKNQNQVIVNE